MTIVFYQVHNTSRRSETRGQRYQNPTHRGYKQFVGGQHRLVTGRPLLLTEKQIAHHLAELKEKVAMGLINVTTVDGRTVSLDDACFLSAAALPPTEPRPVRVSDSLANDELWGNPMEPMQGTEPVLSGPKDFELPPSIGVEFGAEPTVDVGSELPEAPVRPYNDDKKCKKKRS